MQASLNKVVYIHYTLFTGHRKQSLSNVIFHITVHHSKPNSTDEALKDSVVKGLRLVKTFIQSLNCVTVLLALSNKLVQMLHR
jgi:hypothetical protein